MSTLDRIRGFPVYVFNGKNVFSANSGAEERINGINGPHQEAKWAKDLLGCNLTAGQRKAACIAKRKTEEVKALLDLALKSVKPKKKKWKTK